MLLVTGLLAGCSDSYVTWNSAGPIQVIGNKSEVWIFLEFDRQVAKNSSAYDYPTTYPVGHFQEILVLDKEGLKQKIKIKRKSSMDGVSFHPNNISIFRYADSFYIYAFSSMHFRESFFKWDDSLKRFVLLPVGESLNFLESIPSNATFEQKIQLIEELSEKSGWKALYKDRGIGDNNFRWNEKEFVISLSEDDHSFEVKIDYDGDPIILKYEKEITQIDTKGFKALSREEYGHRKTD